MKQQLKDMVLEAARSAMASGDLPRADLPDPVIERPKQAEHGDLATNLAMQLARPCRKSPRDIAAAIKARLDHPSLESVSIAGPGFMNFTFKPEAWMAVITDIMAKGADYGRSDMGKGKRVMVEFVSANPTGPLHVGHGRGAVLGDVLAKLLAFAGYDAVTEYYINDAGNQMNTLGRSLLVRARQAKGSNEPFPEKHYQGGYMKDLAALYLTTPEGSASSLDLDDQGAVSAAAAWCGDNILAGIKDDLKAFGVELETYYSEKGLVEAGAVQKGFDQLKKQGHLSEKDGALWFASSAFGDEKDRVVKRSNGETTYFASDIAYHLDKFRRGFDWLIDIWGADHHGYVPRMKAAVEALGYDPEALSLILVQLVNLLRAGEPVAMTTRGGQFVTLREVVDEVGKDSARFIFLTRRSEAQLDFDLEVAKQKSMDNPVFYVQYAHTRVKSILRKAAESEIALPDPQAVNLAKLSLSEEVAIARLMDQYPEIIEGAASALEPHRITYYLRDLAGAFHSYYNAHRVLVDDRETADARLVLVQAVGLVLAGGLGLLGVDAPETM